MIEPLKRIIVENHEDGTQITKLPTNEEMMNKINEVVNAVNKMQTEVMRIKWRPR